MGIRVCSFPLSLYPPLPYHLLPAALPLTTHAVVSFTFETGSENYKDLENGVYVGAGHFVKEEGAKGLVVEYKVSRVVYGGGAKSSL